MSKPYTVWTTKNGREIPVAEMTDEHVINTIRAMQEGRVSFHEPEKQQAWLTVLQAEAIRRGRSWAEPAFDKVSLVEWVLGKLLCKQDAEASIVAARQLLAQAGITPPQVDVSRFSGKVTYLHWEAGEGKGTPVEPGLAVGDRVRCLIPFHGVIDGWVTTHDSPCPPDYVYVKDDYGMLWMILRSAITILPKEQP